MRQRTAGSGDTISGATALAAARGRSRPSARPSRRQTATEPPRRLLEAMRPASKARRPSQCCRRRSFCPRRFPRRCLSRRRSRRLCSRVRVSSCRRRGRTCCGAELSGALTCLRCHVCLRRALVSGAPGDEASGVPNIDGSRTPARSAALALRLCRCPALESIWRLRHEHVRCQEQRPTARRPRRPP